MKIRIVFTLIGFVFGIQTFAQNMIILQHADRLLMHPAIVRDSVLIDQGKMVVKYRFVRVNNEQKIATDILMQIGEMYMKQTDMCLYYDNLIYTTNNPNGELGKKRDAAGDQPSNIFAELIYNRTSNELDVVSGDFFTDNRMRSYTQQIPKMPWQIIDEQHIICGYLCRKAIGWLGSREWSVWYTTEIPISLGPWKLNGLPGLILAASAEPDLSFECVAIYQDNQHIFQSKFDNLQNIHTLSKYLQYERNCFEHPYQAFSNGEPTMVITKGPDGKRIFLNDSWTIPYNPIERE